MEILIYGTNTKGFSLLHMMTEEQVIYSMWNMKVQDSMSSLHWESQRRILETTKGPILKQEMLFHMNFMMEMSSIDPEEEIQLGF